MIDKEVYIKANVPTSIYNAIYGSYYGEGDVYKLIYNRCYSYDNCGICSMDDYYRACMDYINKMKYEKKQRPIIGVITAIANSIEQRKILSGIIEM